jgi:hypothetical protein
MNTIESYFEPLIGLNDDGLIDIETAIWLAEKISNDSYNQALSDADEAVIKSYNIKKDIYEYNGHNITKLKKV